MSDTFVRFLIVVHAITSILMAWPFYALIVTGERGKLLKKEPGVSSADFLMENVISRQSYRCVVYQLTLLISGALIVIAKADGELLLTLQNNLRLLAKVILVLLLVMMNTYMVFYLQPRIDRNMAADPPTAESTRLLAKFRGRRRWMAAVCLWYVLMAVMLGVQAWTSFGLGFIIAAAVIGALFVLNAYLRLTPYGFV